MKFQKKIIYVKGYSIYKGQFALYDTHNHYQKKIYMKHLIFQINIYKYSA